MASSDNRIQIHTNLQISGESPKPPRRFYLGHSRQNSLGNPEQYSDTPSPKRQPKSRGHRDGPSTFEKPAGGSPSSRLPRREKSKETVELEEKEATSPLTIPQFPVPQRVQPLPSLSQMADGPSTPIPKQPRTPSKIPKFSLSPKIVDTPTRIIDEPRGRSAQVKTDSTTRLSSHERDRKVKQTKSRDYVATVDMSLDEKSKVEQGAPKEESFIHISEAPTDQLAASPTDVSSRERKRTNSCRTSTLSHSSDKTLADDQPEVDTHTSETEPDVTFADALKGPPNRQNENGAQDKHCETESRSDTHSDDSYPELDEMTLDEIHRTPSHHVTYSYGDIRWAPWHIPTKRRLQTLMVLVHCLSIAGLVSLFFAFCANPFAWPLLIIYLMHVLGSKVATDGSLRYRSEWLRSSNIWHLFAGYFPAKLHKTHNLPPTRKYIFGYHPHGIISHGAWAAFATEALGFSEKFPGITNSLLTLDSNFRIPFYRDYILGMGMRSVSKESIVNILSRGGSNNEGMGRAVTIVIGGARESLEAQPGHLRLILKDRKGFIKIAVRTGADLVPVLAFGENDLYDQLRPKEHPIVHKVQMFILKVWKFTLPFLHGRGIFNYDVGMMPYRHPLNVVVGAPIKVQQSNHVDNQEIDRLHHLYVTELQKLWDRYKDEFSEDRKEELQILH